MAIKRSCKRKREAPTRGRPKKRGRVKRPRLYNARGKFDDEAYGHLQCLIKTKPEFTLQDLADSMNCSRDTVQKWMTSEVRPSEVATSPKKATVTTAKRRAISGRRTQVKKCLTQRHVKKHAKSSHVTYPTGSVRLTARALAPGKHPHHSKSTVHRDAKAVGLVNRSRRRCPQMLSTDCGTRKAFALKLRRLLKAGMSILPSDEKKFDTDDHGNRSQWVLPGQPTDPRHRSQAAHSIHVWGVISTQPELCHLVVHDGVDAAAPPAKRGRPRKGEVRAPKPKARTVTGQVYVDKCLKPFFGNMATATKKTFMFMHDGARAHTCKVATEYLENAGVKLLEGWPARSPDLNPIEKVWSILAKRVSDRGPMDKANLEKFVIEEFKKLVADKKTIPNLINGLVKRCTAVIDAEGAIV